MPDDYDAFVRSRTAALLRSAYLLTGDQHLAEDLVHRSITRATLRTALLRLTASQRAVLVARFFEDRTEAETASLLGVSVGTVKSQTARALRRLRDAAPELADLYRIGGAR